VAITTELRTTSAEQTEAAGERLAAALGPGDVVALVGELGAGKTCFIQGLVRGLGATTRATSPTFVLINQYRGRVPIYHVDAYRTQSLGELLDIGVAELLSSDGVTVVEWAEKLLPLLPTTRATSPTFVLINQYRGRVPIYHVDAYRTQNLGELLDVGVAELLSSDGVTIVEWAEKLLPLLPSGTIEVRIAGVGDEPRTITMRRLDLAR